MINKHEWESCQRLDEWAGDVDKQDIDAILEWLKDSGLLNEKGEHFAHTYWDYCYHNGKHEG